MKSRTLREHDIDEPVIGLIFRIDTARAGWQLALSLNMLAGALEV